MYQEVKIFDGTPDAYISLYMAEEDEIDILGDFNLPLGGESSL